CGLLTARRSGAAAARASVDPRAQWHRRRIRAGRRGFRAVDNVVARARFAHGSVLAAVAGRAEALVHRQDRVAWRTPARLWGFKPGRAVSPARRATRPDRPPQMRRGLARAMQLLFGTARLD